MKRFELKIRSLISLAAIVGTTAIASLGQSQPNGPQPYLQPITVHNAPAPGHSACPKDRELIAECGLSGTFRGPCGQNFNSGPR